MYQYNTYKDSGVEWIGEIPIHWSFVKLKYEYNIQKGKLPNEVFEESSEHLIPYLSMEFLRDKGEPKYVKQTGGVLINEGDLLILWDGSNSGEILKGKRGILSSTTGVLKKTGIQINENYSFYILKCIEPEIRNNTVGMGIPHVDGDFIRSLSLLTPPLHEQEQIVAYLDEKTSQIDRLVQAKERKIALLKEYRSSLISRVVTKGLDPNVKMKDSGVEWIGEIPEGWNTSKLKFIGFLYGGLTGKGGDDFKQEENPKNKPYIPYTNIFRNTYISKDNFDYVVINEGEKQNKVQKHDLFFLMSSETYQDLGKSCILVDEVSELYLNSFCKGFRITSEQTNPLFINYQLLGHCHRQLISIEGRGFTRINLRGVLKIKSLEINKLYYIVGRKSV
jgi:type I restriction enzyme S subunit